MNSLAPHRAIPCIALALALWGCDGSAFQPEPGPFTGVPQTATIATPHGKMTFLRVASNTDFDIWVGNADGTNLIELSNNDWIDGDPVLSPSARQIAFSSDRASPKGPWDIYVMRVDGSDVRRLTDLSPASSSSPHWSPSGQRIAFESGDLSYYDIYVMNADGTDIANLTNRDDTDDIKPVWSPSGQQIAFASGRDRDTNEPGWDLYVMNADGTNVRRLTTSTGFNLPWSWSPSGQQIAFYRTDGVTADVYVIKPDGTGETKLTTDGSLPSFSPNGKQIIFSRNNRPHIMNADGSDIRPILISLPGVVQPWDWSHP